MKTATYKSLFLRTFLALLFSFFTIGMAKAQSGPGTTGAVALKIPVNPRAIGMAQAFTAVADDSSAVYWNPAGLAQMQGSELMAEYDVFIETVTYNYFNAGFKMGNDLGIGLAGKFLGTGTEQAIDGNGNPTSGTIGENYSDFDLALGYRMSYNFDIGFTAKYITETLSSTNASTFAVDLGFIYRSPIPHLKFAFDVQNLGPGLTFVSTPDPLPLTFKLGTAYEMFDDSFTLACDVDFPNDDAVSASFGGEYWYKNTLAGRFGYQFQGSIDQNQLGIGAQAGLYLGAGVKVSLFKTSFGFDYAWTNQGVLGANHHFSLAWYF